MMNKRNKIFCIKNKRNTVQKRKTVLLIITNEKNWQKIQNAFIHLFIVAIIIKNDMLFIRFLAEDKKTI